MSEIRRARDGHFYALRDFVTWYGEACGHQEWAQAEGVAGAGEPGAEHAGAASVGRGAGVEELVAGAVEPGAGDDEPVAGAEEPGVQAPPAASVGSEHESVIDPWEW